MPYIDVFIVLEEDDRKCEGITRRCEFGYMEYGTVCDASVVAVIVTTFLNSWTKGCPCCDLG